MCQSSRNKAQCLRAKIISEVDEPKGCNSKYNIGDKFYVDFEGDPLYYDPSDLIMVI